jgi:hypothetical protein
MARKSGAVMLPFFAIDLVIDQMMHRVEILPDLSPD